MRVPRRADRPPRGAHRLAADLSTKSPDALAAAKRLFNDTWHASPHRTFARERAEQAYLLIARNTRAAREAAFKKAEAVCGPRGR